MIYNIFFWLFINLINFQGINLSDVASKRNNLVYTWSDSFTENLFFIKYILRLVLFRNTNRNLA